MIFLEEQIRLVQEKIKKIKKGEIITIDSNQNDDLYELSIEIVLGNKTGFGFINKSQRIIFEKFSL